jgi:hypothetical protein
MAAPGHNIFNNEEYQHDPSQWVLVEADSSSRPPHYNPDNCSSAALGDYSNGLTQVPHPAASPTPSYQYEKNGNAYYQSPQSYASSTASVPCPEGVEREDPNLALTYHYLPLVPDTGLNEAQHRRSASIHSDMSYQMSRFLLDQQRNQPRQSISPPTQNKFLPQDIYIQSQSPKKAKKDKKRGKLSYQSFESSNSEDQDFVGWGVDPTVHTGEWIEDGRLGYYRDGYGYSLSLSGMTDELNGE